MRAPRTLVALLLSLLAGCASDREVYLDVPISRLETPTPAPRMLGIGLASGGSARVELTHDQTTTSPTTDTPAISPHHTGQARFDVDALRPLEISVRAFSSEIGGAQVKWMPLQPGPGAPTALALTFAYGQGDSHFTFTGDSQTRIRDTMTDGAVIVGWQFDDRWLLFGGPYYSHHDYHGSYHSDRGSSPNVDFDFQGLVTAAGGNVALAWTPANWTRIAGEYSLAKVEAGSSARTLGRASIAITFTFGPRTYPEATAPSDKPEVVPPDQPGAGG